MTRLETAVPPPVWALLVGAAMFGVNRLGAAWSIGTWGRLVGVAIWVVAFATSASGIATFRRAGTTVDPHDPSKASALVVSGVYRITRNPMYVGLALLVFGWGFVLRDPLLAIVGAGVFAAIITRLQIVPEERMLRAPFGADYEAFLSRTRRWI